MYLFNLPDVNVHSFCYEACTSKVNNFTSKSTSVLLLITKFITKLTSILPGNGKVFLVTLYILFLLSG